jgi:predicted transcriptional regulator
VNIEDPWSPEALAEDERRLAEFERTRMGVPWDEVQAWMQSWGKPNELPMPKLRKI